MMLLGMVGSAYASKAQEKIIFKATEIKDQKLLDIRMDKGITEDSEIRINAIANGDIYTDETGHKYKVSVKNVKYTSQKLEERTKNNARELDFVLNSKVECELAPVVGLKILETGTNVPGVATPDNNTLIGTLYQTTYYSYKTDVPLDSITGGTTYKFSSTASKAVTADNTVSLTKILIEQTAWGSYFTSSSGGSNYVVVGGTNPRYDVQTYNSPSTNTYYNLFANNTNYWWWVLSGTTQSSTIVAGTTATFKRGSSTFTLYTEIHRS